VIFAADVLYKNVEEAAKTYQFDKIVVVEVTEYMPSLIKPLAKRRIKPPQVESSPTEIFLSTAPPHIEPA
jgi:long-chain acyl-CoA synthetase